MKIGVEASAIFRPEKTGIPYYASNLIKAAAKQMPDDQFYLCYINFLARQTPKFETGTSNVHRRRFSLIPGKIWNALDHYLIVPPIDLLTGTRADVFLFMNYFRWPLAFCKKTVLFVHDLGYLDRPEFFTPRHRAHLRRRVKQSIAKSTAIATISEHTKQQLMKHYGLPLEKITVMTPAVDHAKYQPAPAGEIAKVKQKYSITKPYLLFLGTMEPRKNITGIIRAYQALPSATKNKYQLVLAGGKGWLDEEIDKLANAMSPGQLIRTGYVQDGDEPALYSGAEMFLYPSHYEGWGMQILEAMACGTPVITANNSSLPEAGGKAATYVTAGNDRQLADAVSKLLRSDKAKIRKAGFEQSKKFSWEKSAKILADLVHKL